MWHWATNPQVQLVLPAMLAKSSDSVFWNLGIFWRIEDYSVGLGSDTDKESKDSGVLLASLHATLVDASLSLASHYPVMNRKARHFFKHPVVLSRILFFFNSLLLEAPPCVRLISKQSSWRVPSTLASTCMRRLHSWSFVLTWFSTL